MRHAPWLGLALLLAPMTAQAHHDAGVGRIGVDLAGASLAALPVPFPRLALGVSLASRDFGRTLRGSDTFAGRELAAVTVHTTTPRLELHPDARTRLGLSLPMGWLVGSGDADVEGGLGVGDLQLRAARRLASADRRAAWLQLALAAPTGRYAEETALSLVDLDAGDDGSLAVRPYDTRASLGAGAWSATGSLVGWTGTKRVVGSGELTMSTPLTETRDGIRWGSDLRLALGGDVRLGQRVRVGLTSAVEGHTPDHLDHKPTEDAAVTRLAVGGRVAWRAGLRATVRPTDRVVCAVQARLPVWQHVQGTQLVETVLGQGSCRVAIGLMPQPARE